MLKIAVCDDLPEDRAALCRSLAQILGRRGLSDLSLREYCRGENLLCDLEDGAQAFDLIFLDIFMDGLSGMETARRLREQGHSAPLVFLTTSPDFALDSYGVEASGYLLKPLEMEKLERLLARILEKPCHPGLVVRYAGQNVRCDYEEILYIESRNNITLIYLSGGKTVRCGERLDTLERTLGDPRFLRCHQSYLVNMDCVHSAEQDFLLRDGSRVPIRVRSRRELIDAYYRYYVERAVRTLGEEEVSYV